MLFFNIIFTNRHPQLADIDYLCNRLYATLYSLNMNNYDKKIDLLRAEMKAEGVNIYVLSNSDPHQSEYLPDHWKCVEWLTGFKGEVATVLITPEEALLWTDSRFFISGAEQLRETSVRLMKLKIDIDPTAWLEQKEKESATPPVIAGDLRVLFGPLAKHVTLNRDYINVLWKERPSLPLNKVEIYPEEYAGESAKSKINRILEATRHQPLLLSSLDDIAWTLNLRGSDIACTPVFTSYLLLSDEQNILYIDPRKLTTETSDYLKSICVGTKSYEEVPIGQYAQSPNPVPLFKAIKNEVEIKGFRSAMLKDGIALTRFYRWLEEQLQQTPPTVTELDCVQKLIDLRREQPLYKEESFPAIVAWNEHAAMPHYENCEKTNVALQGDGLLLIDTGGQYLDGTTDITRTIGVGNVSDAMRRDYTLVLKGHIRLAQAVFPVGTRGDQLDVLARMDLWRDGKTYLHGTSHGVGHYLGVHEGPQSVRMEHNPQALIPGMVFSNEPAIYLGGQYGIRHENCVLVRDYDVKAEAPEATPCDQEEQGRYLHLETLTWCYIDTKPLNLNLLNNNEIEWINCYNQQVFDIISPHLTADEKNWLKEKCKPI